MDDGYQLVVPPLLLEIINLPDRVDSLVSTYESMVGQLKGVHTKSGANFERYVARFLSLRKQVVALMNGSKCTWEQLHRGAQLYVREKGISLEASDAANEPLRLTQIPTRRDEELPATAVDAEGEGVGDPLSPMRARYVLPGAQNPGGDIVTVHSRAGGGELWEAVQTKFQKGKRNVDAYLEERGKAASSKDAFVLVHGSSTARSFDFGSVKRDETTPVAEALVSADEFDAYFGPYAGGALSLKRVKKRPQGK